MTIPVVTVDAAGISVPSYAEILAAFQDSYRSIYGSDIDLADDTQDGQWLAVLARAFYDANAGVLADYLSRSPSTAQGAALSSLVAINGIARLVPSNSQAVVTIVGVVGTTIVNGVIGDSVGLNTRWDLPASVTIPLAGEIDVTATCQDEGATAAAADTLTEIITPTRGWQSVTNAAAASPGAPVESDAALRRRQAASTALPALTVIDSLNAALLALAGVTRLRTYENDTDAVDANGITAHSIAVVILGGDTTEIVEAIALKKTPGTGTDGDVEQVVVDSEGVPNTIRFYELSQETIEIEIDVVPLDGYSSAAEAAIKQAVADWINGLDIGEDSYLARLSAAASLIGTVYEDTFVVSAIRQGRDGDPPAAANIVIAFNEAAITTLADITVAEV